MTRRDMAHHAPVRMAHREPSPYAFTLREYTLVALAAVIASPLLYAFLVLALTAMAS